MKSYFIKTFRGNPQGQPELLEANDPKIVKDHMLPCPNYSEFNPTINIIKSKAVVNGSVVYVLENLLQTEKDKILETEKRQQKDMIFKAFEDAPTKGYTCSLGFKVDCNRLDMDNIRSLIYLLENTNQPGTIIRDYNNEFHELTLAQIKQLLLEMTNHGLSFYQIKWTLEQQINAATTIEAVQAINWPNE